MADLRQKEQMIDFLREGMTVLKKVAASRGRRPAREGHPGHRPRPARDRARGTGKIERGQLFANRYEIVDDVGKGGMGVVYRARDRQLDEVVALKVLRSEALQDDPTLLERFKQEIKLARKITHRNVLRTHDFGEADGLALHLDGVPRGRHPQGPHQGQGRAPARGRACSIAKQMCNGLEAAHRRASSTATSSPRTC